MILKKGFNILQDWGGHDPADPLVVKQEICRAAEKYLSAAGGAKRPPGDYLLVELAADETTRQVLDGQLVKGRLLEQAVRSHLRQEGFADAGRLQVEVKFVPAAPGEKNFCLKWYRREVAARLTVLKGRAEKKGYLLDRDARQIFIGRGGEVVDKHGFLMRRNNVVFDNSDDEVNSSISRRHGWLQFDEVAQSFRLYDPESKQGTRVERDGRVSKVSPGGVTLRDGDVIHSGKGEMRFTLKVSLSDC